MKRHHHRGGHGKTARRIFICSIICPLTVTGLLVYAWVRLLNQQSPGPDSVSVSVLPAPPGSPRKDQSDSQADFLVEAKEPGLPRVQSETAVSILPPALEAPEEPEHATTAVGGDLHEYDNSESIDPDASSHTKESVHLPSSEMHVIFSTDCSDYQDWQTEIVFRSAILVSQPGRIVRIASGCSEEDQKRISDRYAKLYPPRFMVHFTPQYNKDEKTGKTYHFYNKPRGLLHWLKYANPALHEDAIVALIDPDFAFMRPLTPEIGDASTILFSRDWKANEIPARVSEGVPAGQQYGLGAKWLEFKREYICGADSPCTTTTRSEANKYFPVGPPYIMHRNDWVKVAHSWVEFVPKVFEEYPYLLAEMYAYCMAAAHHGLKHIKLDHMMLSLPGAGGEGWPFIEPIPADQVCTHQGMPGEWWHGPLPVFFHFCQNYRVGEWMFPKRKIPRGILSDCQQPLLEVPPKNITKLRYRLMPPKKRHDPPRSEDLNGRMAKLNAFAICMGVSSLNPLGVCLNDRV